MMSPDLNLRGRSSACKRGADSGNGQSHSANRLADFLKVFNAKHLDAAIQWLRLCAARRASQSAGTCRDRASCAALDARCGRSLVQVDRACTSPYFTLLRWTMAS